MKVVENQVYTTTNVFSEEKILNDCRECFSSETEKITEVGERFIQYFLVNASKEGVLFKTIKEITTDINISHQTLTKVLKLLESKEIIYRRNGIIGLWKG
ncbi:MAG: replication/maintenance protein RepL [Planococcus donghaensis]